MTPADLYAEFRSAFPDLARKADEIHIRIWTELDQELFHLWFEYLAEALNEEMRRDVPVREMEPVFAFFQEKFNNGGEAVKNCIDVSLVENLFWEVPPEKAGACWRALPKVLRALYVGFHHREPV